MSDTQLRGNYTTGDKQNPKIKIVVIGVGGAGTNAVNSMYNSGFDLPGVTFVVCNTDYQSLDTSPCPNKIQLGVTSSAGMGAGKDPEFGALAAKENLDEIEKFFDDIHMVFITFGAGGGTGSPSAPLIAEAAKKRGILTVGVATKPFNFEGLQTMEIAKTSIKQFKNVVDALVVISNENIQKVYNNNISMLDGFKKVDDILGSFVASVTRIITKPGLINLDFADVRASLKGMHALAMVGIGESESLEECDKATDLALSSPLLDNYSIKNAPSVVVSIEGGPNMTLCQVHSAVSKIQALVGKNSKNKFFFGAAVDETLKGMRISILATLKDDLVFDAKHPEDEQNNHKQELVFDSDNTINSFDYTNQDLICSEELYEEIKVFEDSNKNKKRKQAGLWWERFCEPLENSNKKTSDNNDGRDFFNKG